MKKALFVLLLIFLIGCTPTTDVDANLVIKKLGDGGGTVTSSPVGIACGVTCNAQFDNNTQVTINAIPDEDSNFLKWTGDCSGTGVCSVGIDSAKEVTAVFELDKLDFLLPANLPGAIVGQYYLYPFPRGIGGHSPYKYRLATGVGFPPYGLTVAADDALGGTPTTVETRTFDICIVDARGKEVCKSTRLVVTKEGLTGKWEGPYELSSDVSTYCPNIGILKSKGKITSSLELKKGKVTGSATLDGLLNINIDGFGKCSTSPGPSMSGEVSGNYDDKNIELVIDFGDPDLFVEKISLKGTFDSEKITGDLKTEGAEGKATLFR